MRFLLVILSLSFSLARGELKVRLALHEYSANGHGYIYRYLLKNFSLLIIITLSSFSFSISILGDFSAAFLNANSCSVQRSCRFMPIETTPAVTSLEAAASVENGSADPDSGSKSNTKPRRKNRKNKNNKKRNNTNTKKNKKGGKQKKTLVKSQILSNDDQDLLPLTELKLGSTINGYVASFTPFGIFIKTSYDFKNKGSNGYALLHKSQIRDEKVDDLTKLFRIGARVKGLRVININYAKGEVGVSLRNKRANRKKIEDIAVGSEIEGTVANVLAYGAFVDVGADANALLHISRISQKKIRNIRDVISEGENVTVRILSKDVKKKTMAASMLDKEADEYLNKRSEQMKQMRESANTELESLKTEIEYFEEAVRELEETLGQ